MADFTLQSRGPRTSATPAVAASMCCAHESLIVVDITVYIIVDNLVDIAHIHNLLKVSTGAPAASMDLLAETGADILQHFRREIGSKEIG